MIKRHNMMLISTKGKMAVIDRCCFCRNFFLANSKEKCLYQTDADEIYRCPFFSEMENSELAARMEQLMNANYNAERTSE